MNNTQNALHSNFSGAGHYNNHQDCIGVDTQKLLNVLYRMDVAGDKLVDIEADWSLEIEESKVFDKYIDKLFQVARILRKYGELVKKDTEAIRSIGLAMEDADNNSIFNTTRR